MSMNFLSHEYFYLRSQENASEVFTKGILWLQLQNNLEFTYRTKLWKDIRCTESKTVSFSNCQIVVPNVKQKKKKGEGLPERDLQHMLKFTLCVDECQREWNT